MEIRDLEVIGLSHSLPAGEGLGDVRGLGRERSTTQLRVETADGTVGWGEAFALGPVVQATVDELFRDEVVGMDPFAVESLANAPTPTRTTSAGASSSRASSAR